MHDPTPAAGLCSGFFRSLERCPDRPALEIGAASFTYADLGRTAGRIADAVGACDPGGPLAGVFATRSLSAYAGVLGVLASGKGYVPLNKNFPAERTRAMLTLSGCRAVVVGVESLAALGAALAGVTQRLTLIFPDLPDRQGLEGLDQRFPQHAWVTRDVLPGVDAQRSAPAAPPAEPTVAPHATAYLMFTSGSTGVPKGVPVSHANGCAYMAYASARYGVHERDRLSQTFDMTFDLSVHDMFLAWWNGACLVATPERSVMAPAKHIKETNLSMWFSVPSVAMFMSRLRQLKPGAFPALRWSLFCGEPLPARSAELWQAAAPNSVLENLYGPTEATIACAHYRWDPAVSPSACRNGIVPIGTPFTTQSACVAGSDDAPAPQGGEGELCVCGSQVTAGYLNNPEKTAAAYVQLPACGPGTWYRTGDLVTEDESGCLHYLSRIDHQVKIRGYRVELAEIEHQLRLATGADMAACVPWPVREGLADGVYGFVVGPSPDGGKIDEAAVLAHCETYLPEYMVPRRVFGLAALPLNANGKIDRRALSERIEELDS